MQLGRRAGARENCIVRGWIRVLFGVGFGAVVVAASVLPIASAGARSRDSVRHDGDTDTTALYAEVLSAAVSRDAQFVYDLGWQAAAVQETGYAVVAVQNEARASYLRAVEENQRQEAVAAFLRASAARTSAGGGGTSRGTSSGSGSVEAFLACTRAIESTGNYGAVSPGGKYRGAYQFDQRTWDSNAAASGRQDLVGVDPANAAAGDQDQMARDLYARRGNQPWGGRC
jgi:hypothetical protein